MVKVVLIDDEPRLLSTLARFLQMEGHEVVAGARYQDVEPHLWPGRFEVLVSDIVMPDIDGMQVLRRVVEERGCQEPVILITGEPSLESASAAVRLGAFDYIQKPVTKEKLLEAVARGLRHVKLLRERDAARNSEMLLLKNLAEIGESASILTHEIKTPITSLRHALCAVGDKLGVTDKVLVEEFVTNLTRIERLLSETLSFAKPLFPRVSEVELSELVERSVRACRAVDAFAGMQVDVDIEQGLVLRIDEQMFQEVLENLLRNAAEACDGSGRVRIEVRRERRRVVIDCSDDGPGVPPEQRVEIFKPFSSSKHSGTGIGLAFSRKVVESHLGSIDIVEREQPGACFRIELPARSVATRSTT